MRHVEMRHAKVWNLCCLSRPRGTLELNVNKAGVGVQSGSRPGSS